MSTQTDSIPSSSYSSPVIDAMQSVMPPAVTQNNDMHRDRITRSRTPFLQQPKVLYVSDTVGSIANLRMVEKFSKTRVNTVKYSSSGVKLSEAVNSGLSFPGREPYEILTISAPLRISLT